MKKLLSILIGTLLLISGCSSSTSKNKETCESYYSKTPTEIRVEDLSIRRDSTLKELVEEGFTLRASLSEKDDSEVLFTSSTEDINKLETMDVNSFDYYKLIHSNKTVMISEFIPAETIGEIKINSVQLLFADFWIDDELVGIVNTDQIKEQFKNTCLDTGEFVLDESLSNRGNLKLNLNNTRVSYDFLGDGK